MKYFRFLVILYFLGVLNLPAKAFNLSATLADTTEPFRKEIPIYPKGDVDIFYKLAKSKQGQLGLDSLENGFDSFQLRIWYDYSFAGERRLVVIANDGNSWRATVYDFEVDWDGYTETIISRKIKQVTPKSGWDEFSRKLLDLKVLTLPDQKNIPKYSRHLVKRKCG